MLGCLKERAEPLYSLQVADVDLFSLVVFLIYLRVLLKSSVPFLAFFRNGLLLLDSFSTLSWN